MIVIQVDLWRFGRLADGYRASDFGAHGYRYPLPKVRLPPRVGGWDLKRAIIQFPSWSRARISLGRGCEDEVIRYSVDRTRV